AAVEEDGTSGLIGYKKHQLLLGKFGKVMFVLILVFCLFFAQMAKSCTLRGYPYFWKAPLIFIIFRNE
ncbi:hypothetical protein, partial [Thiolapillus sp.]|uniref:hypothetical protein n=1 Tax=Thiolapillus sp. TaxID=2017437 RepID=UPI003AF7A238